MKTLPEHVIWALGNTEQATPPAIDRALAWFYGELERPEAQLLHSKSQLKPLKEKAEQILKGIPVKDCTTARDGLKLAKLIESYEVAIKFYQDEIIKIEAASAPLHAEYQRRGGWSRYFLALTDSQDGHIHRSMHCSTCNREGKATRFGWLTDFSGRDEHSLTDEVGPNACTVCFPWAETIRVEADKAAKEAKAAEKAALAAEKARVAAEKGITDIDGLPLYDGDHKVHNIIKSLRSAEIAATDALFDAQIDKRLDEDPETHRDGGDGYRTWGQIAAGKAAEAMYLIRAIAAKKGQTFEETLAAHEKKADAKLRKADREWAKNPRNPKNHK